MGNLSTFRGFRSAGIQALRGILGIREILGIGRQAVERMRAETQPQEPTSP